MSITIKDVALRAGVSIQTVSNVLNRRVNVRPKTRSKVLKACEELNYTPNAAVRSLVTRKSKAIGLIDAAYDLLLKVPEDLAVIGFDDIFAASIRPVSLTTIKFDIEGIAESAILRLINKMSSETVIRDRKYVTVPCQLIVRSSCGANRERG